MLPINVPHSLPRGTLGSISGYATQNPNPAITPTGLARPETADKNQPLSTAIGQRDIDPANIRRLCFPIEPPPKGVAIPIADLDAQEAINDDKECYLLNTEDIESGSYLSKTAVRLLKERHPGLFDELNDNPETSEGGGWNEIMADPFNPQLYQKHQAIAKLVFDYDADDRLDELFTNPDRFWVAHKTTYGIYRTNSCHVIEDDVFGNYLFIDPIRYGLNRDKAALEGKVTKLEIERNNIIEERNYYRNLSQQAADCFAKIAALLQDASRRRKEKLKILDALHSHPQPITLNHFLAIQDLITGTSNRHGRKSFLPAQKSSHQGLTKRGIGECTGTSKQKRPKLSASSIQSVSSSLTGLNERR